MRVQNDKLSEEASYAKELASAAAVELKNLAGEVTKLSLQNAKLEKELLATRDLMNSRGGAGNRKYSSSDGIRPGRKGRPSGRSNDDFESWNLDVDDLKMELQARKQKELALEAALAEKEFIEEEYRRNVEEAKRREAALENDLANMWVLVAQLKKDAAGSIPQSNTNERHDGGTDHASDPKIDISDGINPLKESKLLDVTKPAQDIPKEEPLVARLKVKLLSLSLSLSCPIFSYIWLSSFLLVGNETLFDNFLWEITRICISIYLKPFYSMIFIHFLAPFRRGRGGVYSHSMEIC